MADDLQVLINVKSNADEATRGLDKLGSSVASNLKVAARLEKQYKTLDAAFNSGKISAQTYAAEVTKVDNSIKRLSVNNYAAAKSTQQLRQAQLAAGKATNRFNANIQQVGYQVGDFAVQVQSGTNALVALGQQGAQLLGIFGAGGALAGAFLAIGTAVVRYLMEAKGGVYDLDEALELLEDTTSGLKDSFEIATSSLSDLTEEYGMAANEVRQLAIAHLELKNAVALDILEEELMIIRDTVKEFSNFHSESTRVAAAISNLGHELSLTYEQQDKLQAAFTDLVAAPIDQKVKEFKELSKTFEELGIPADKLPDDLARALDELGNLLLKTTALGAAMDRANAATNSSEVSAGKLRYELELSAEAALELAEALSEAPSEIKEIENLITVERTRLEALKDGYKKPIADSKAYRKELEILYGLNEAGSAAEEAYISGLINRQVAAQEELDKLTDKTKNYGKANKDAEKEAEKLRKELERPMVNAIGSVSDAFGDFIARGLTDFKDFVKQILASFQNMIAQMIAMAVKNRIMLSLGIGGITPTAAAAGEVAGLGSASTMLGSFGTGAGLKGLAGGAGFLGGVGNSLAAFSGGIGAGFGASFSSLGTLFSGGASVAAGGAGYAATIGAALPAIVAVAAVVGLLTKKTKLLDSGLRATVEGFDVAIQTFQLTQSSRLFGLLKGRKKLGYADAPAELADPLIEAIGDMQQSIVDAAGTLGIGASAFDDFSYQFKLSLMGLTEEQKLEKINKEITKMGDAFASLTGHFETMNELLAVAQQRYDLETRLLQLQGNETELLIRQRERERAATHELNQGLLDQIHAVEDAQIAANKAQMLANEAVAQADLAFATVQRSIQARKEAITRGFNEIMETIQNRIETANENVSVSSGILSSLEGASSARIGMSRGAGLAYLRELRGASRITDEKMLDEALQAVADPSQGLYTNFVDYQRDFADQSNLIRELEEKAGYQLETDEQTLLQLQEEANAAQSRYEGQIDKLDEQLAAAQDQINALKGIDTSVKSVEAAIAGLGASIQAAAQAQAQAAAAAAAVRTVAAATGGGSGGGSGGGAVATKAAQAGLTSLGTYSAATAKAPPSASFVAANTGKAYYQIRGESQLLTAAQSYGIQTTGKTGTQIQNTLAKITNSIVNMDNKTRAQQFAMGGMFGGGIRMVGERGPEIEATGPSRIFSTKQTAELFRNPELVAEVRSLREEVAGLRSESRQLQASNSKYVKRNYDINRKWDTEGLPATRT